MAVKGVGMAVEGLAGVLLISTIWAIIFPSQSILNMKCLE